MDALTRHEIEMCYVERAYRQAKGLLKKDLRKHLNRMHKQRMEYLKFRNGSEKVEKQSEKSL